MTVDLLIVGAGPAGLCAAWEGQQLGWAVVVLDLADGPGGVWRKAPRRMQALSPRQRDRMPDGSTPLGTSDHAEAGEIQGMLEAFADGLDVDFRFGVKANGLLLPPSGDLVVTNNEEPVHAQRLLIATGEYNREHVPPLPGLESFKHHHSGSFDPAIVEPGDRVVVVGARASASDLVGRMLGIGADIVVSTRGAFRSSSIAPPNSLRSALYWAASGIRTPFLPPGFRCRDPILPLRPALQDAADRGDISVVGEAVELTSRGLRVEPEGIIEVDHVVFATGYRRDVAWLGQPALSEEGRIQERGGLSTTVPGLGFLGIPCMRNRRSGFLRGFAGDAAAVVRKLA